MNYFIGAACCAVPAFAVGAIFGARVVSGLRDDVTLVLKKVDGAIKRIEDAINSK
jgi:hypothetical protein